MSTVVVDHESHQGGDFSDYPAHADLLYEGTAESLGQVLDALGVGYRQHLPNRRRWPDHDWYEWQLAPGTAWEGGAKIEEAVRALINRRCYMEVAQGARAAQAVRSASNAVSKAVAGAQTARDQVSAVDHQIGLLKDFYGDDDPTMVWLAKRRVGLLAKCSRADTYIKVTEAKLVEATQAVTAPRRVGVEFKKGTKWNRLVGALMNDHGYDPDTDEEKELF